jgi:hypothetical protein
MNPIPLSILKPCLACCLVCLWTSTAGAFSAPDAKAPGHFAGLVSQADHVAIALHPAHDAAPDEKIIVRDRAWIEAFAAVMEAAIYQPTSSLLGIGFPVTFVAENGRTLLNLQVLGGGHVRLNSRDFQVGSATVGEIARLVSQAHEADATARDESTGSSR